MMSSSRPPTVSVSSAVNSVLLRSLKEHYLEASKMTPPQGSPPSPFSIIKGALESHGPVIKREHGNEEISIYVMRLNNMMPDGEGGDDDINQLFLHVEISKPGQKNCLHFLCGLYLDALGIHSVSTWLKLWSSGSLAPPSNYTGPVFQGLDGKTRAALHSHIEEQGLDETLFPFLQAWFYVKDHRSLMHWFKRAGD